MVSFLRHSYVVLGIVFQFVVAGCAHYPINARNEDDSIRLVDRSRFESTKRSTELFIALAFSGGGTRAAALSYGVLETLSKINIQVEETNTAHSVLNSRRLLDEVDIISSVSGGSYTAAYYGLYGDRIFTDYKKRFLNKNVQGALFFTALAPHNFLRNRSPYFGRSDMAAEYYDQILFDGKTLGDFHTPDGPVIWIMATDVVDGLAFSFSPYLFALTCMDYDSFPVARAVAASAAFPGLLSPIVLRNYAGSCGVEMEPWIENALATSTPANRTYALAEQYRTFTDSEGKPYIHLLDGGIADNLGLRGVFELFDARGAASFDDIDQGKIRKELIIIVDASSKSEYKWSQAGKVPGLKGIISSTSSVMVSSTNYDTIYLLHQYRRDFIEKFRNRYPNQLEPKIYIAHLQFSDLEDEKERQYFHNIPTSLKLPGKAVDDVIGVAGRLLSKNKEFQVFVQDVGGKLP